MTTKKTKKKSETVRSANLEWCNRVLVSSPVFYSLCTSESAFRRGLKALGHTPTIQWVSQGARATTHCFEMDNGTTSCVVCIHPNRDLNTVAGVLSHEAMHIWREIREVLGEANPSAEFEAYSVQSIVQGLFNAYVKQTSPNKRSSRTRAAKRN